MPRPAMGSPAADPALLPAPPLIARFRDSNGAPLAAGDDIILIKDLKVRGAASTLKKGTKIKSIRLPEAADGHDVECRLEIGTIMLKSEFLKKA